MLPCIFDQLPSWQLSGEVFKLTARRLQFWICSFSPRLHWWGQEWNTLVGTNQDKKSPGTHLGLTLWLSSALRVPICRSQLPEMMILSEPWPIEAEASLDVSDFKYKSLPFVWRNHPKPHLMPQTGFKHLQRRTALIWGEKGRKGAAPLMLQLRCEGGKMRVLTGPQVRILQT